MEGFGRACTGVDESTDVHRPSTDVNLERDSKNGSERRLFECFRS